MTHLVSGTWWCPKCQRVLTDAEAPHVVSQRVGHKTVSTQHGHELRWIAPWKSVPTSPATASE